jgi:hypothetical protein
MKKESLEALGARPALPDDLPPGLLDDLKGEGIAVYKVPASKPVIVHQGRYRLYELPDGTLRVQYRRDGAEADDHIELPGAMVRLAKAASEGNMNPLDVMKAVTKMMRPPR